MKKIILLFTYLIVYVNFAYAVEKQNAYVDSKNPTFTTITTDDDVEINGELDVQGQTTIQSSFTVVNNIQARTEGNTMIKSYGLTNPYVAAQDYTNNSLIKIQSLNSSKTSGGGNIGAETADGISLVTDNTKRIRIEDTGEIDILTNTTIQSSATIKALLGVKPTSSAGNSVEVSSANGTNQFTVNSKTGEVTIANNQYILGNLGIGFSTPTVSLHIVKDGGSAYINMEGVTNAEDQSYFLSRASRGSVASRAVVNKADQLLTLWAQGFDGTTWKNSSQMIMSVDETPGTNDMPGNFIFKTSADGGTTLTERMRIAPNGVNIAGHLTVGTTISILRPMANIAGNEYDLTTTTSEFTVVFGTFVETNDEGFDFSRTTITIINIRAKRLDTSASTAMGFSLKNLASQDIGIGSLSIPANETQSNIVTSTQTICQDCGIKIKVMSGRSDQPVAVTIKYWKRKGQ